MKRLSEEEMAFRGAFWRRLVKICEHKNLSKTEVSIRAGFEPKWLIKCTNDLRRVDVYEAVQLAKVLNVSMDTICGYKKKCTYTGVSCDKCGYTSFKYPDFVYCPGCGGKITYKEASA